MEFTATIEMEPCPRCNHLPRIVSNGQYQARCACGVCGVATRTELEAKRRWRSVVYYMREHQPGLDKLLQVPELGTDRRRGWITNRFMRE